MTRELLHRSIDARQVPALLASPSGGNADGVVIYSEVDQLVTQLQASIATARQDFEQADQDDTTAWQAAIEALNNQISQLQERVTGQLTVGSKVETLAAAQAYLSAVPASVPMESHQRLVLVASETDSSINGVYKLNNNIFGRAEGYTEASSYPSGFEYFVDDENQKYKILNDGVSVSESDPLLASVEIGLWTRVEAIIAESPLQKIGTAMRLLFDAGYLAVENGELTLSTVFKQRISTLETNQASLTTDVANHGTRLTLAEGNITTANNNIADNQTAISSANTQISALQTGKLATDSAVATLQAGASEANTKIDQLEASDAAQGVELSSHSGQLADLNSLTSTLSTDVAALNLARPNHDGRITNNTTNITALQSSSATATAKNVEQDARIDALELGAAALAQTQTTVAQHGTRLDGIDSSLTDLNSTITAHGSTLAGLNDSLDSKIDTAALQQAFTDFLASTVKVLTLTGGVVDRRVDTDDNIEYYFTTFEISTGFGDLNFVEIDLSEASAPYTRLNDSYTFQRIGVDSLKIMFQSRLAAYPDDYAKITIRKTGAAGN